MPKEPEILMTAQDAARKVEQMRTERGRKLCSSVKFEIQRAIEGCERSASLDVPFEMRSYVRTWLESLGYKVSCGDDQRDGTWFTVSW